MLEHYNNMGTQRIQIKSNDLVDLEPKPSKLHSYNMMKPLREKINCSSKKVKLLNWRNH